MYFYHPDHLGSSSYITDKQGTVIQHTEYIAFGEILFDEHSISTTMPYLFNGKELDSETGLYYYGARYYDPRTSIWLNVDPLAEKTMTPYAYVNNNPINAIDPDGRLIIFINGWTGGANPFYGSEQKSNRRRGQVVYSTEDYHKYWRDYKGFL